MKMPVQKCNSKISSCPDLTTYLLQILITINTIAYFVKRGNFHTSQVLENGLLGIKVKMEIFPRKFFLSKKEVFRKLPVQKTGWMGLG